MEDKVTISKQDLFEYTYYDDNHSLTAVLNENKIKEILGVDIILLEERFK